MEYLAIAVIWVLYIAIILMSLLMIAILIDVILSIIDTIFGTNLGFIKWNFKYRRIG